jgi:hypothetical protein
MVQDTSPSPEMYLARLRSGKCGGWGIYDIAKDGDESDEIKYDDVGDCVVVWATSVPGETAWYKELQDGAPTSDRSSSEQYLTMRFES